MWQRIIAQGLWKNARIALALFIVVYNVFHLVRSFDHWLVDPATGCKVRNIVHVGKGDWASAAWSGDCVDGKAQGLGIAKFFLNDRPSRTFEGTMEAGAMAHGTLITANGDRYEGEWRDDRMEGHGTLTRPDGAHYDGDWHTGVRSGQGTFTFADGRHYAGEWHDDHVSGQGTMIWPDGRHYEGGWRDSHTSGQGIMTKPNTWRYEGEWHDGKMIGQGTFLDREGNRYEGHWSYGKPDGEGSLSTAYGRTYNGIWKHGCFHDGERTAVFFATPKGCGFE
jgi:hypothetical protein